MNVIQFNTFNNFYQVIKNYNTDFEILIYNKDDVLHDKIIGQFPEGSQAWAGAARSGSPVGTQVASHSFEFPRHLACRRGASPARVPSDRQERVCVSVWLRVCAGRLPGSVLGWYASGMHSGPW